MPWWNQQPSVYHESCQGISSAMSVPCQHPSANHDRPQPSWLRMHTAARPSHHVYPAFRQVTCVDHRSPPHRDHTQKSSTSNTSKSEDRSAAPPPPHHGRTHRLCHTMETENTHDIHGVFDIIGVQGHTGEFGSKITCMQRHHGIYGRLGQEVHMKIMGGGQSRVTV